MSFYRVKERVVPGCQSGSPGCRRGTAWVSRAKLEEWFGESHIPPDGSDGKVTHGWQFMTPRGPAEVRDYWWNRKGEYSIAAENRKAALWLAKRLRELGVEAGRHVKSGRRRMP